MLALMAEGRSNKAIAGHLVVTEHTVEKHVKNIFATLGLPPPPVSTSGSSRSWPS